MYLLQLNQRERERLHLYLLREIAYCINQQRYNKYRNKILLPSPRVADLVKEASSCPLSCLLSSSADSECSCRKSLMAVEASSLMGCIILCRTGISSCRTRKQSFSISLILARSCCKNIELFCSLLVCENIRHLQCLGNIYHFYDQGRNISEAITTTILDFSGCQFCTLSTSPSQFVLF